MHAWVGKRATEWTKAFSRLKARAILPAERGGANPCILVALELIDHEAVDIIAIALAHGAHGEVRRIGHHEKFGFQFRGQPLPIDETLPDLSPYLPAMRA